MLYNATSFFDFCYLWLFSRLISSPIVHIITENIKLLPLSLFSAAHVLLFSSLNQWRCGWSISALRPCFPSYCTQTTVFEFHQSISPVANVQQSFLCSSDQPFFSWLKNKTFSLNRFQTKQATCSFYVGCSSKQPRPRKTQAYSSTVYSTNS